jgi:hypothetical protein
MIMSVMPIQMSGQAVSPARPAFPDHVLYELFFRNLALINRKADELERSSGRSNHMREAVCARLSLGDQDCKVLLQTAAHVEARLAQLDKQARSIIDEVRKKHKERPAGAVLPPPPAELAQLQAQRNSLTKIAVAQLKQQLTQSGSNALADYVVTRQDTITPTLPKDTSSPALK